MECFAKKYCDQNEGVFTSTGNLTVQEYPPLLIVRELYELIFKGGKNRRALLAGNVKQLQEIRLNEDLLLKI